MASLEESFRSVFAGDLDHVQGLETWCLLSERATMRPEWNCTSAQTIIDALLGCALQRLGARFVQRSGMRPSTILG